VRPRAETVKEVCKGLGRRLGGRSLSPAQNRPGGGAITVFHLDRQTDQLVLTRLYPRRMQAFSYPNPGAEERLVRLGSDFVEPADREVVNATVLTPRSAR
jgi:hypothetical protein